MIIVSARLTKKTESILKQTTTNNILPNLDDYYKSPQRSEVSDDISQKLKYSSQIAKKSNHPHKPSSQRLDVLDDDNTIFPDLDNSFIYKFSQKCQITKNTHKSSQRLEILNEDYNNVLQDFDNSFIYKSSQKSKSLDEITKKSNHAHKSSSQILEVLDDDDNIFSDPDNDLICDYSQKPKSLDEIIGNSLVSKTSSFMHHQSRNCENFKYEESSLPSYFHHHCILFQSSNIKCYGVEVSIKMIQN
ncbi:12084_t:CDS:2 [Entrophospora sp. SA101]|nr:11572_t:CDS:2 [Entrophospora sp. SA101]CAJ0859841.1 12084_t:CDS:2 [Entrophospora sp. SA101]